MMMGEVERARFLPFTCLRDGEGMVSDSGSGLMTGIEVGSLLGLLHETFNKQTESNELTTKYPLVLRF